MKKIVGALLIGLFISQKIFSQQYHLKTGRWIGGLALTNQDTLYFEMAVRKLNNEHVLTVINGKERLVLNKVIEKEGNLHASFQNYNSELVFQVLDKQHIKGHWVNHVKENYQIPFEAKPSKTLIFSKNQTKNEKQQSFAGKWKTQFSPEKNPEHALGVFSQKGKQLTGTFLSETGDYRFLAGNVFGTKMYLSGFDGTHAFYFNGELNNGKINGSFFSGNHFQTNWVAERDDNYSLRNPDSLTHYIGDPHDFSFQFIDLDGNKFSFPNEQYTNKVTIIQILGTWCGNCLDETVFLKEMYDKYTTKGLDIITVGYEIGKTEEDYVRQLKQFKNHYNLNHTILVGGNVKTSKPGNDFSLSNFMSYPTSIVVDKKGKIVKIHTGFSGPGTGVYYQEFKEKIEQLIKNLLDQ